MISINIDHSIVYNYLSIYYLLYNPYSFITMYVHTYIRTIPCTKRRRTFSVNKRACTNETRRRSRKLLNWHVKEEGENMYVRIHVHVYCITFPSTSLYVWDMMIRIHITCMYVCVCARVDAKGCNIFLEQEN